ncbi:MAG: hypothetical protein ACK5KR_00795 [Breznakia sp.]
MKRRIKAYLICMSFFTVLTGCKTQSYRIDHKRLIEYQEKEINICDLIEKIDGHKILEHHRNKQKIRIKDYTVSCKIENVRKLGKHETSIDINGITVELFIMVQDTTAPKISSKNSYVVEKNNPYFDIKKLISAKDNYDHEVELFFTGNVNVEKAGKYLISVTAKDSNKNTAKKQFSVVVNEKEIKVEEKMAEKKTNQTVNNNTNNWNNPTNNNGTGGSSGGTSGNTGGSAELPVKRFTVDDGYTIQTGFTACKTYRATNAGSCSPFNKNNGLFGGYIYIP